MEKQQLSDDDLEKISVIEDINKLRVLLDDAILTTKDFETLMSCELGDLVYIHGNLSDMANTYLANHLLAEILAKRDQDDDGN
jgi:hypothetical protein